MSEETTSTEESLNIAPEFQSPTGLSSLHSAVEKIRIELGKLLIGQHKMIDLLITAILADGHVLIEGVPGIGKTLSAKLLAKSLSTRFSRIQFTPDLMPSDVLGTSVFNSKLGDFEFHKGPIFSQIVLIDEINRAPAKTQAALFEVMEEKQITIDGETYLMDFPFIVLATQNPIEQEGTYRLPEAQLDRFLFKIEVDYPALDQEMQMLANFHKRKSINDLNVINQVLSINEIQQAQETVKRIHIEEKLISYIVEIVNNTRNNTDLYLGASPRASISMMLAAQAVAAMRGRSFVKPEDVQYVAGPVLIHRVILTPEREMEGFTNEQIIEQILKRVIVPR